jgi:hypothetical protein
MAERARWAWALVVAGLVYGCEETPGPGAVGLQAAARPQTTVPESAGRSTPPGARTETARPAQRAGPAAATPVAASAVPEPARPAGGVTDARDARPQDEGTGGSGQAPGLVGPPTGYEVHPEPDLEEVVRVLAEQQNHLASVEAHLAPTGPAPQSPGETPDVEPEVAPLQAEGEDDEAGRTRDE